MKKALPPLYFLTGLLLLGSGRRPPWPSESFTAVVDGRARGRLTIVRIDETPCLSLNDTRRIFGGRVGWRRVSRKFTYHLEGQSAEFSLDSSSAVISGKTLTLEANVRWWGDTAYLPVSLFATPAFQSFAAARIQWDPARPALTVDPAPSVSSPRVFAYPEVTRVSVEIGPQVDHRLLAHRGGVMTFRLFNGRAAEGEKLTFPEGVVAAVELRPRTRTTDLIITLVAGTGTPEIYVTESPRTLTIDVPRGPVLSPERGPSAPSDPPTDGAGLRAPGFPWIGARPGPDLDAPYLAISPLKTIVIDPGHGGKDPGAVGPHGTLEKDVNLRMALVLAKLLRSEKRFRVILTRSDDRFVTLEERSSAANRAKADLFVSFHCNAGLTRKSSGFEVYYLSEKATDDEAAAVARRENAVVELEGVGGKAREKVEELLWSLARNEHMNDSSEIAAHMARQVGRRLSIDNRGVKQAGFHVLRGTSMPAVLVETGFITHPREEGLLRSSRHQQKLVDALYTGLLEYEKRKIQARLAQSSAGGD